MSATEGGGVSQFLFFSYKGERRLRQFLIFYDKWGVGMPISDFFLTGAGLSLNKHAESAKYYFLGFSEYDTFQPNVPFLSFYIYHMFNLFQNLKFLSERLV